MAEKKITLPKFSGDKPTKKPKTSADYQAEIRSLKASHERAVKALQDEHQYTVRRNVEKQQSLVNELEGFKLAANTLKDENVRLCNQLEAAKSHEREVWRLRGLLDGLVAAGKIDPFPETFTDPTAGTHTSFLMNNRK